MPRSFSDHKGTSTVEREVGVCATGPSEGAPTAVPQVLATLVQCLRRYVDAHPERFRKIESRRGRRRIVTIVLANERTAR